MEKNEQHDARNFQMIKPNQYLLIIALLAINISCGYIPQVYQYNDPLTAEEHNNLGVAYEKEGNLDLALKEYEKSVKKDSNLVTPLVNIGNIYLKKNQLDKAEKYYLRALAMDEYNIGAANNLANVYLKMNDKYSEGIEYLSNAVKKQGQPSVYALDTLSELYIRSGQIAEAKKILEGLCISTHGMELHKAVEENLKLIDEPDCSKQP